MECITFIWSFIILWEGPFLVIYFPFFGTYTSFQSCVCLKNVYCVKGSVTFSFVKAIKIYTFFSLIFCDETNSNYYPIYDESILNFLRTVSLLLMVDKVIIGFLISVLSASALILFMYFIMSCQDRFWNSLRQSWNCMNLAIYFKKFLVMQFFRI